MWWMVGGGGVGEWGSGGVGEWGRGGGEGWGNPVDGVGNGHNVRGLCPESPLSRRRVLHTIRCLWYRRNTLANAQQPTRTVHRRYAPTMPPPTRREYGAEGPKPSSSPRWVPSLPLPPPPGSLPFPPPPPPPPLGAPSVTRAGGGGGCSVPKARCTRWVDGKRGRSRGRARTCDTHGEPAGGVVWTAPRQVRYQHELMGAQGKGEGAGRARFMLGAVHRHVQWSPAQRAQELGRPGVPASRR